MASCIHVLYINKITFSETNFIKLCDFFGVKCKTLCIKDYSLHHVFLNTDIDCDNYCIASSGDTFTHLVQNTNDLVVLRSVFLSPPQKTFILFNISPDPFQQKAISWLTNGCLKTITYFSNSNHLYQCNNNFRGLCKQFTGVKFGPINPTFDFYFNESILHENLTPIITIDNYPFFVKYTEGMSTFFIIANNQLLDIDQKVLNGVFNISEYFSRIIPVILFLKYEFSNYFWSPEHYYASLIIDDPLLKSNFGFLNYQEILEKMDQNTFFTNIAFIPFNFKRSRKKVIDLFKKRSDRFMICVHGCDHTKNEFGITDHNELHRRIQLASERMARHEEITHLPYDKVMVFPQGVFSVDAINVLRSYNFLGVVNTEFMPVNTTIDFTIADFLKPVIMKFYNFPFFLRRHPDQILDFAFDLFIGRPVLIVEHPSFLKEGYIEFLTHIKKINSLEKDIIWDSLATVIRHTYLKRKIDNKKYEIQMFGYEMDIKNTTDHSQAYIIRRYERDKEKIVRVLLNSHEVPFEYTQNTIELAVSLAPSENATVKVCYKVESIQKRSNRNLLYDIKARIRRYLSEFRDDIVIKNKLLTILINKLRK